ncbi:tuberin-like isoform X2 [Nematostella vectensis]|uniref:tuberin-like isoform X2 n=1 Tax=Nematostella vectensis TaxID=45351 RepID=UPI0020777745|nr:tuberin-like isoform X2 [Nematostella vectensis]
MSKQHSNDGFRQKFKQFLGIKKGSAIATSVYEGPKADELTFTNELLQEISSDAPVGSRIRVLRELCEFLVNRRLEDHAIEAAWMAVKDLLLPTQPQDARHVTLYFLSVIVTSQYDRLKILRAHFFKVIENHKIVDDLIPRLNLLKALSNNGKDILYFEEQIGVFLLSWMSEVIQQGRLDCFMPLMINVIHYNSSYLDEDVAAGIIRETSQLVRTTKEEQNVELSLSLLDAIVRYSCLPVSSLYEFVAALCCTVNLEKFCQHSWKIMRNVLGTHLGHRCIYTMCLIMETGSEQNADVMLIRGAVFFIGMCLWGSQRVTSLKHSHSAVLPSMLQALHCNHTIVALEVTLSIQRLVKKYGHELHIVSWDSLMDITEKIQELIQANAQPENSLIENHHILLNAVEELMETSKFNGSEERFFTIVERCASKRPENSVHLLVSFKAQSVHPAHAYWISNLKDLMEKYFRYEIQTSVRVKVLDVLSFVLTSYRHWYEEELLDKVVLPYLSNISDDPDVTVRTAAVQLLLDLSQTCDSPKCTDILNIIEKVINRKVELSSKIHPADQQDQRLSQEENVLKDVKTAINGLVQVLKVKLFRLPHCHAQQVFGLLVSHVRAHYYHGYGTIIASIIRNIAFECFLSLRCDSSQCLGFASSEASEKGKVTYSSYFVCAQSTLEAPDSTLGYTSPLGVIQYSDAFSVILSCIQYEWDWTVLEQVLTSLPDVLQNKTLVLAADPNLTAMSSVLCKMVCDPACVLDLQRMPQGVGRTGLHALIFPVLTVLATYHTRLDRQHQCELVQSLELGFGTKCASLCVSSLTLCTMEMQAVITSLLPAILVRLSQVSATVLMAVPMLEFLSGLVHLPHLYTSFKETQYKSVFAICLPYTDSARYSQYTVTLAFHVIAAWFVRARVAYRRGFVGFIAKALRTSMALPAERYDSRGDSPSQGTRGRTSSVGTGQQSYSPQGPVRLASPVSPPQAKETEYGFHAEMSEVCMDMMARYAFAPGLAPPKRTAAMDYLLSRGISKKWLVGNTIVTITTSGTSIEPDGICDNCYALRDKISRQMQLPADTSLQSRRRRSRENILDKNLTKSDASGGGSPSGIRIQPPPESSASSLPSTDGTGGTKAERTLNEKAGKERPKTPEPQGTGESTTPSTQGLVDYHCVCQGWAEIFIRKASGNVSWVMRLENRPAGPLVGAQGTDGDIFTGVMDDKHVKEYSLPPGDKTLLKVRTKSREVLGSGADSDTLLIDLIRKDSRDSGSRDTTLSPEESAEAKTQLGNDVINAQVQSPSNDHQLDQILLTPQDGASSSPGIPCDSTSSDGLPSRPRLLSASPRRGPYAIRMARNSECQEHVEELRSPEEPPQTARRQLLFEKPELGVSPAEYEPISPTKILRTIRSESNIRDSHPADSKVLSSSEMYRLASDEEVQTVPGDVVSGGNQLNTSDTVVRRPILGQLRTKAQRPKSLPGDFGSGLGAQALLQDPESHTEVSHPKDGHAKSRNPPHVKENKPGKVNSGGNLAVGNVTSAAVHMTRESRSATSSPLSPKKTKLHKSSSLSAPKGQEPERRQKPGNDPRTARSAHVLIDRSDGLEAGQLSRAQKSSSSPELSSPTLGRTGTFSRPETNRTPGRSGNTSGNTSDTEVPLSRDPPQLVPAAESYRYPLDPSFLFLQLYHSAFLGSTQDKPVPLPDSEVVERAVKCLDRIPPYDTHKIGVIYVGEGQHDVETAILRNVYGSARYMRFLGGLGRLVRLRDCAPAEIYLGGLDREGADGEFAYSWQDDICQVIFHVATLMPTKESDPGCNSKKMHIGNDFVTIVYNDSGDEVKYGTIKGQFNFAEVVIQPLDNECNVVMLRFKEELKNLCVNPSPRVISDSSLPMLVRRLAVHINMASVLHQGLKRTTDAYGCNWLERMRQIKRLRSKIDVNGPSSPSPHNVKPNASGNSAFIPLIKHPAGAQPNLVDFTEYASK